MSSHTFGAYFDIVSGKGKEVTSPPPTHQRHSSNLTAPNPIELDEITFGTRYNGPTESASPTHGTKTPNELEMSRPPTPKVDDAVSPVQTWYNPPMNKWRVLAACMIYFTNGMNDAATGALIPSLEVDYNIGYAIVSLVFVTNAVGFIAAAFFVDPLVSRVGRGRSLMIAEGIILIGYIMLVTTPPYPVVALSFFFLGFGAAITLAINNVFCANLASPTVISGLGHGSYGIGGTIAPIIATALVSNGIRWSRFYCILLGLAVSCGSFAGWAFWHIERDQSPELLTPAQRTATVEAAADTAAAAVKKPKLLKTTVRNPTTSLGALFIFAYQGAEVAVSGWVISFLINYRHGDPAKVGNVTAGFWGGITIGRFVLTHFAHRIGEVPFVYGLIAGSIALQLLVWLVPNVIGNAVAVSLLGLLLGPVYPCAQTIFARTLPRHIQMTSIGFISSAGSSGGAVAPFTTGLLAQAAGTWVLHPICVGMFVLMTGCWYFMPRIPKRRE